VQPVAPVLLQVRVLAWPAVIELGLALNATVSPGVVETVTILD
jgi:hypothetical protein